MRAVFVRAFELAVFGLAALAFFKLPLGARTPFEHVLAIAKTEPAKEAGRAVYAAMLEVRRSVVAEATGALAAPSARPAPTPRPSGAPRPNPLASSSTASPSAATR